MKNTSLPIFRRFALLIFCITSVMGILFMIITYLATTFYHEASTELLNKDVAAHIAKFTSPFTAEGISRKKADSVFQNAMVLSPASEVYFLDTTGKVMYFHASEKEIKDWNIRLEDVERYINAKGEKYVKGIDPKDPSHKKIFSAAVVQNHDKKLGYIYVILDSRISENTMDMLFGSHILNLAIKAFLIIILLSLLFSLLYIKRTTRNFQSMISVIERFEEGDYSARFNIIPNDELQPVRHAFNKMATLLSANIEKVTASEQERKNFIAGVSHDLRTPLAIARGYIETFMFTSAAERDNGEQQRQLQLTHAKILQIENMVSQLFELSKIEAVEFSPSTEPFVLSEIVQEAADNFMLSAREKNIQLRCVQCKEHTWVRADIAMFERVIQNLIENAVKNTTSGGMINIFITVENKRVIFKIENDGNTLSPELHHWINNFSTPSGGNVQRPKDAGLGFMIVQKILQLHHSKLEIIPNLGKNIFIWSLPLYEPTTPQI